MSRSLSEIIGECAAGAESRITVLLLPDLDVRFGRTSRSPRRRATTYTIPGLNEKDSAELVQVLQGRLSARERSASSRRPRRTGRGRTTGSRPGRTAPGSREAGAARRRRSTGVGAGSRPVTGSRWRSTIPAPRRTWRGTGPARRVDPHRLHQSSGRWAHGLEGPGGHRRRMTRTPGQAPSVSTEHRTAASLPTSALLGGAPEDADVGRLDPTAVMPPGGCLTRGVAGGRGSSPGCRRP
jgi:hypothetical protein